MASRSAQLFATVAWSPSVEYNPRQMIGILTAALVSFAALLPYLALGILTEYLLSRRRTPAPSVRLNLAATLLYLVATQLCGLTVTTALISSVRLIPRPPWIPEPHIASVGSWIGWTAVVLITMDFFQYWAHRAEHAWLWRQHAVHHSDTSMNVTTAWRVHWTEPLIEAVFTLTPLAYLFDQSAAVVYTVSVISTAWTAFAHLNIPFRSRWLHWFVNTPQFHRSHHSYLPQFIDRNFAVRLPVWDMVFGTYTHPATSPLPTGLASGESIDTVWAIARWPIQTSQDHRLT